jgi:WD40 repeat protein
MTDIAWMDDLNGHATTLCLCTSSMRLYYAQVDEITSAFSVAVPETACPCVYTFQSNENATSIKGFRLFHAENDATILSGSGQNKYDDILAIGFDSGDISIMHSRIDRMRPLERFKIHCHSSTISAFLWIADMSLFVAASHDSNISIHTFNLSRDGVSETKMFIAHSKAIHAIVYSSQDAVVASCGLERDILVWSPFTTQLLARLTGHLSSVFSLAVELQSSHLISLGSDRQVHVWSLTKFNCLCKRKLVTKLHRDVDIKSLVVDGSSLIFGINFPLIWPISKTALPETKTARSASHNSQVLVLLQSDQFEQLITVQADGQATTWAMATGVEITNFCVTPATSVAVNCATLDPKQRRLVVGADDGIIRIYNIFNGQLLHELFRSSSASSSGSSSDIAEVSSLCFVQRQMRTLLAATFSDTSSISFWPEYPTTSLTSAVFNLDIRGQFGVGTPEQIGFLLKDHTSASSNVVVMLMANGKLASISVDSGHTLFEFSVKKTDASFCTHAVSNPGHLVMCKHSKPQTALAINEGESVQSSIRMFVLAHHKNYLIAVASENCVHCWDFARNTFSKSFRVPSRVSGCASTILCMDLSSEDSMLCLGDSHGWIHTYVSLFSAQTDFQAPKWSFHSQADSVSQIKFFGTLEIILSTGSDMVTRVWRLDGKHFLHDESQSSSIDRSFLRTSSSSHALGSSTAIGALACAPWEFRSILLAQGNFSRNSKPRIKDTVHILQRMKSEAKVTTAIIAEQIEHPRPQLFLKSLKLLPPATAQEAREQSRMLLALATPRRGLPATANAACHLQALRGPHCKIHVHPIAPDPYLSPTKGYSSRSLDFMKQDPCRTFLPKDSFKDSILRQEEQVPVRTIEASPLLKRSLKQVSFRLSDMILATR